MKQKWHDLMMTEEKISEILSNPEQFAFFMENESNKGETNTSFRKVRMSR